MVIELILGLDDLIMNLKCMSICVIIFVNLFLQSRQYHNDLIVRNEVEILVPKFLSGKDHILNSILQKINILSQKGMLFIIYKQGKFLNIFF